MSGRYTVVRAAAGCGKTTDLALRWLSSLAGGLPPERVIAITFTRRAAAELAERVALALRACIDDEGGAAARRALGRVADRYAAVAPKDPEVARSALARLPDAPIGTTDAFVQRLLTELALDAVVPLADGRRVALDLPLTPGAGTRPALERAARRILDPPGGALDPDVALLAEAWSFDELVPMVSAIGRWDDLPLASTREVLDPWTRDLAQVLQRVDLAGLSGVGEARDEGAWREALAANTNEAGRWAVDPVAAWLSAGASPDTAPYPLFGWLVSLNLTRRLGRSVRTELLKEVRDTGPGTLDLWQIVGALKFPYDDPAMVARADDLRRARDRVRRSVVATGLREAALAGDLTYDELLSAAIDLVERPPERLPARLHDRFGALLVDEIQDANPRQLRLYRALAALPGMDTYFVGDARQSIYLFRDAEPEGLRDLEREVAGGRGETKDLLVNHRSAPRLVAAHRALFDRLADPMRKERWRPIDDLARLGWDEGNAGLAVGDEDPVWIVVPEGKGSVKDDELDDRVLSAFLERLDRATAEPGHEADTAVVLTPSWALARRACERIRAWRGRRDAAFVEGAGRGSVTRVAEDLVVLLRALWDDEDDLAWLGVWKHPCVGLTDAALARAAAGVGLLERRADRVEAFTPPGAWRWRPGRLLRFDGLSGPHDEGDRQAFARARPALVAAKAALGRTATSSVLDQLITALDWRILLASGPGGADDLAELEVLLDWIRDRDGEGLPPDVMRAALLDDQTERPQVHVARPRGHVACTTVFQAKGLAWDHVAVLRVGTAPGGGRVRGEATGWMTVGERRLRLDGLHFDPRGGLSAFKDPISRLAGRLQRLRSTEECARLAYVAVTRARRTVTLGLQKRPRGGVRVEKELRDLLPDAWLGAPLPDVAVVERGAPPVPPPPLPRHVEPTGEPLPPRAPPGPRWHERAPSSLGAHLDPEGRQRMAELVTARVRLVNGLHLGRPGPAPPGSDPRTGLPVPGHRLEHMGPTDWGNLAHGWFARWGFRGPPDPEELRSWLDDDWGAADEEVVAWLLDVSRGLETTGGPIWRLVTDGSAKLHFEHPLLGVGRAEDADVLLSGRIDLLVEHGRRWSVVDFKAGARTPTGWHDLVEGASLRTYAFQLHAYAQALTRTGRTVDTVALWFVRSGTSVRWTV